MRENLLASHSRWRRLLVILLVLVFLGGLSAASFWYLGPFRAPREETFVEVERGMSSRVIADLLAGEGLVRSRWAFLAVRALQARAKLQAGEYRFGPAQTPWEIFDKISRGQVFFVVVTIPEGSNRFDIAAILGQASTIQPNAFLAASAEPESIRDLDPKAPSLEGYLFPSSYQVTHTTTAKQLCRMMTNEFRKQWRSLAPATLSGGDVHRAVTLASLVEKETGLAAERPLVAGVFTNRLRLNMPLQCDPTTVYAALLDSRYNGVIHKSDLASANPYNTYAHRGLPPGPIANPGAPSLQAALHPSAESYLYFVARADGSGGHHFSATLTEHEKAVADFRKTSH
jgi:UPF0755 protein